MFGRVRVILVGSGGFLGPPLLGPGVFQEGPRRAAGWLKVVAKELCKNLHFLHVKRVLVGLGGPLGAPFEGPPAKDPTAEHERYLCAKLPSDGGPVRREENGPQVLKKMASKSMHFLQSKLVLCSFWGLRLGLPVVSRRGSKPSNTTDIRAQCRGSLSKGLVKHVVFERFWPFQGPKL